MQLPWDLDIGYKLHLKLPSLQGENVACLTSIFGAEFILRCAYTPHQKGILNALKEFSNKGPSGFPYMHGRGNILILCTELFSFCCCWWSLSNRLMNYLMSLHSPDSWRCWASVFSVDKFAVGLTSVRATCELLKLPDFCIHRSVAL